MTLKEARTSCVLSRGYGLELQGSRLLHAAEAMCQTDEACLEQTEAVRGKAVLLDIIMFRLCAAQ